MPLKIKKRKINKHNSVDKNCQSHSPQLIVWAYSFYIYDISNLFLAKHYLVSRRIDELLMICDFVNIYEPSFSHIWKTFVPAPNRFAESVRTLRVLFILLDYAYLCICLYNPFRNLFNYKYEHFTTQQTLIVIVDFVCTVLTYNSCIIQTKVLHYNISMDLY